MITLADDEQDTALRAVKYALSVLMAKAPDPATTEHIAKLGQLAMVFERFGSTRNGVWRCGCPAWHPPSAQQCEKCGGKHA